MNRVQIVRGDIAAQEVDAVVTMIPQTLDYPGKVNLALLEGAGHQLDEFILENIFKPRPGDVYPVPGFALPCRHILFCVTPLWKTEFDRQDRYLVNAVRKAMETAVLMGLKTLAFPALASGSGGFPKPRAARLLLQGIKDRMHEDLEEVRIVCKNEDMAKILERRLAKTG